MKTRITQFVSFFVLLLLAAEVLLWTTSAQASASNGYFREVRRISASDLHLKQINGLAYSPAGNLFIIPEGQSSLSLISMYEDFLGTLPAGAVIRSPLNFAVNPGDGRLYTFNPTSGGLLQVETDTQGRPSLQWQAVADLSALQVSSPAGLTFDPKSGNMFILQGQQVLLLTSNGALIRRMSLRPLAQSGWRGIAFNPQNQHLFLFAPASQRLFELTPAGKLVRSLNLSTVKISALRGLTFAPSADPTDDAAIYDLFLATPDQVIELSLTPPPATLTPLIAPEAAQTASFVRLIDASLWSPPAPDTAGVDYDPFTNHLIVSDSEVDEMPPYFTGVNMFLSTLDGTLVGTTTTTGFSNEPTGVAVNTDNGDIYISDDNQKRVYIIQRGPDGLYGTPDDIRTFFLTTEFNDFDPEDVGYGNGILFVLDGIGSEVYKISPGPNGIFDGVTSGDDVVLGHFDTSVLSLSDVEGIDYNPDHNSLYLVGPNSWRYLIEATLDGALLQKISIEFINPVGPSDVSYAPSSTTPGQMDVYISMRGVDNGADPYENDGKIYELFLSDSGGPTLTPSRTPTPSLTLTSTATPTASATATNTPTATVTSTFTTTPTRTPSRTPTVTLTFTPTNTPTFTPTATNTLPPTQTFTSTNTFTPTSTFTPSPTPTPTFTSTATPTATPSITPSPTPTNTPTETPLPTFTPTPLPKLTFVSNATHDGWVLESSETSGQGGTMDSTATTLRVGDDAQDRQYRSILSFNTAGLPDNATIVSAKLQLKRSSIVGTNPFNTHNLLLVDIRKPYFGTQTALQLSDFQAAASLNAAGNVGSTAVSGYYLADLKPTAFQYINLTGWTQLRLRFQKDDNDDQGADYITFFSSDYSTAASRPTLIIEYTLP